MLQIYADSSFKKQQQQMNVVAIAAQNELHTNSVQRQVRLCNRKRLLHDCLNEPLHTADTGFQVTSTRFLCSFVHM